MDQSFTVLYQEIAVGSVNVSREGLYYVFHCRIHMKKPDIYRLILSSSGSQRNLGICVPVDQCFELKKRIPVKEFKNEKFEFKIITDLNDNHFVAVLEDQPFEFLNKLRHSRFIVSNGSAGLILE